MFFFVILPRLVLLLALILLFAGIFLLLKNRTSRRPAFLIIAALVVLLAADVVLDHRSIPCHVLRWLQGEQGMNQIADDFFDDARKSVDPAELQRWAVTMLQSIPPADSSVAIDISANQVPANIRNFRGFPLKDHWIHNGAVYLGWGGGFGHFGFCIGPPTYQPVPEPDNPHNFSYVEWKPGIYFWLHD
jgi:hypothetical protein